MICNLLVASYLELKGEKAKEWTQCLNLLNHSAIKLSEPDDIIKWSKNRGTGEYTTKLSYLEKMEDLQDGERI